MRLIDADALDKKSYPDKSEDWEEANWVVDLADIRSSPTIAPATNWTPCSVALPEKDAIGWDGKTQIYTCTVTMQGIDRRIIQYFGYGKHIGFDGKDCVGWHELTGLRGSVPKGISVLAWQPLPEPYRGEA